MLWLTQALDILSRGERCVLVTVAQAKGSAPREAGAKMLVWESGMAGSVGGGHLEFQAIARAREMLAQADGRASSIETYSLGPELAQCCGGHVTLFFEGLNESARLWLCQWAKIAAADEPCSVIHHRDSYTITRMFVDADALEFFEYPDFLQAPIRAQLSGSRTIHFIKTDGDSAYFVQPADERRDQLFLFGAGHVGRAVVRALAPLPFHVTWIDGRSDAFPPDLPAQVTCCESESPAREVVRAPAGALFLVMTHSHPLDLEICARVLERGDFAYLGLIGSETKRARFASRLRAIGIPALMLSRLTCPIGIPGISGKEPAAIAAAVAAQLLLVAERRLAKRRPAPTALDVET